MNPKDTFSDSFPPIAKKTWLEKLAKDLKGKPIDDLHWQLTDDLLLEPMYHPDDGIEPVVLPLSPTNNDWEIAEDIVITDDLEQSNQQLLRILGAGVQAVRLVCKEAPYAEDWEKLLQGVRLDFISTHVFCSNGTEAFKACVSLAEYVQQQTIYKDKIIRGSVQTKYARFFSPQVKLDYAQMLLETLPDFHFYTIDGVAKGAEASAVVEELLFYIQEAHHLLDFYYTSKIDLQKVAAGIQFSLGIGTAYFVQIAKIRALRLLWANVLDAYGLSATPCTIEAHLPPATLGDNKYTNMISATTQAMSAVIGGVQRLYLLPSDSHSTEGQTDFAQRIARNVQHLLKMESHLHEVQDPAAGSFYIENMTLAIAKRVWARFTDGR